MRLYFILLILLVVIVCLTEADKKSRRRKKPKIDGLELDVDDNNKANEKDDDVNSNDDETKDMDNRSRYSKKYRKNKFSRKGKFDQRNQMSWLNIKKGSDCEIKCSRKSVCITGPIDDKPICVSKKDLKKSLKLFHRYEKQEMKASKKFKKNKYNHAEAEKYPASDEKIDIDVSTEVTEVDNVKTDIQKPVLTGKVIPNSEENEAVCTSKQFSQMRSRMMGWFHLLHGQDHQARQMHGGNIKHFYKHVSVKKELREYDGHKCECLKSAMWQFHQMDKNVDDKLNYTEMSILEENSMEPCMKLYLSTCDHDGDSHLSSNEWCCCFSNVVAPCYKKVDEIMKSGEPVTFKPRCDREGYYMREQCTNEKDGSYTCWCVDYNGNEIKSSRTQGRAHCSKLAMNGSPAIKKS
ncbi:testican-1 isoform X1 [Biomphalaria glabrata]|nr:testican-1 isoform X1 [Biomphalaria glabrata]